MSTGVTGAGPGPGGCSRCKGDYLLWHMGIPVGPGRPGRGAGLCWYHDQQRRLADGGLPRSSEFGNLERLLAAWSEREERQALRQRGITYTVEIEGARHELTV